MQIDPLDARILSALTEDARRSLRDVARLVDSTPTTVSARLERLKEAGLVTGATLRFAPALLPGRARLVTGRLPREAVDPLLDQVRVLPGVVSFAVGADGRFMALLQVRDLDEEEALVAPLHAAGADEVAVTGVQRAEGPPLAHLFETPSVVLEPCAVCQKEAGADAVVETVDGRRVLFCCASCRRLYLERHAALKAAAESDRRSTTS